MLQWSPLTKVVDFHPCHTFGFALDGDAMNTDGCGPTVYSFVYSYGGGSVNAYVVGEFDQSEQT